MGKIFPIDIADPITRMHDDGVGNYWFYHKGSYPTDEPLLYRQILATASSYIEIWDPYFNVDAANDDQEIFDLINPNITIKILTKKGLDGPRTYLTNVHNAMKIKIPQAMNVRFGLRVINKGDALNFGNWFFHDRFLIIDQSEVFIVSGSVGWHVKSLESTGIFKVDNNDTKIFIRSLFDEYWKIAASSEIPIQYLHHNP